ncbi:lipopolysaccharide kinase InaA family protein [Biformimicrobium ophioploci]|uniref:Lipopolysaccharide kinase InaA family protein n=1 Tax=Biformimicrobium ophioploci TaxID=3036711 RepID=A0ABQ6M0K4_9GAMM|nr:lipopolysaccharide kinase InaA family protein [Microbulbifer sp. NKW57]GMG87880.1 lipopolysaccharide kinase InaA family protein [Microbulbifer sp. NKW57]
MTNAPYPTNDIPEINDLEELREWLQERPLPVQLTVIINGRPQVVTLQAISRFLPEKRFAALGTWQETGGRVHQVLFKMFFHSAKALIHIRREKMHSEALTRNAVPTPRILASGAIKGGGHFLMLEALPDVSTFGERWSQLAEDAKPAAIGNLLELLAGMYDCGWRQTDMHLGNFLHDGDTLYVVDMGSVRKVPLTRPRAWREDLAMLVAQFDWREQDAVIAWLLDAWQRLAQQGKIARAPSESRFRLAVARAWGQRLEDRLERAGRSTSDQRVEKRGDMEIRCMKQWCDDFWPTLCSPAELDRLIADGRNLKDGNSATVAAIEVAGRDFVVKRYNVKSATVAAKRRFGRSRAERSWEAAYLLEYLGIGTPAPVALVIERKWRGRAYFISELGKGESLQAYLPDIDDACLDAVCDFWQALARVGASHGDNKASNFLWDRQCETLQIIDLDALRRHGQPVRARKALEKDIERFSRNWTQLPVRVAVRLEQVRRQLFSPG